MRRLALVLALLASGLWLTGVVGAQAPAAAITADSRQVVLDGRLIFDIARDAPGCFSVGEVRYSPTGQHFAVIADCLEGDNTALVFRADGTNRQAVTAPDDFLSYRAFGWSPDGRWLVYQRVNSFGVGPTLTSPPAGLVRFDVETGEKLLLLRAAFALALAWSPDGGLIAYVSPDARGASVIEVLRADGSALWTLDSIPVEDVAPRLSWVDTGSQSDLLIHYQPSDPAQARSYWISFFSGAIRAGPPAVLAPRHPYAVVDVAPDDVLNIRAAPGAQNPIVGTIPPFAGGVRVTGEGALVGTRLWLPVSYEGVTGWVNSRFITPQLAFTGPTHDVLLYVWTLSPSQAARILAERGGS